MLLPESANTQDPSAEDFANLVLELETQPPAQCWVLGASALNRPIRAWLRERFPQAVIVSMNSGKKLDWFTGDSNVGDLFFGQEGNRERLDIPCTNLFQLSDDFPRLKLDAMLLLQQAAQSANLDSKTLPRTELFTALRRGLLDIDGKKGVFVETRHALWFDPKTRASLSGNVCLKRRLNVETEGLLYAKQYVRSPTSELQPLPVLYLNIDLLSVDSVSIEDQCCPVRLLQGHF